MEFWIQASNPLTTGKYDEKDGTLCEAIETVFPLNTEVAILVWRHIYIPLSYKYDISVIIDEILYMIENIANSADNSFTVVWASNTFSAEWDVSLSENHISINSRWDSVVGGTEVLLASQPSIVVERKAFINEWKKLLENLISALNSCGYILSKNCDNADKFNNELSYLIKITDSIDEPGILYR